MASSAGRLAEIARRMQNTGGVHQPVLPGYKIDPVCWIRERKPCIDSKGTGGVIPFELWPYQKDVVRYFWQGGTYFIKKDRQMGFTTTLLAGGLPHKLLYAMEVQGIPCHFHILADTGNKALDLLRMTKLALYTAKLDDDERELLRGIDPHKDGLKVAYGLHSYVRCHATTGKSVRGYSGNGVLVEEAAFIDELPDVWKSVAAMVSDLGETPVEPTVWVVSSPNGPSHHEELCENAAQWGATFLPYDFRQVPGRDDAWEERERLRLGDEIFEEEHGLRITDDDEPLFNVDVMRRFAATAKPLPQTPQPGRRYVKGLDVSGTAGVTVFLVTDVTEYPAQPVFAKLITGSWDQKRAEIVALDKQWPGPLYADGTWDPSFVGSLNGKVGALIPVRFTGGNDIGSTRDVHEHLSWKTYPRRRMQSGSKKLLGSGMVVVFEETNERAWAGKLWKAVKTAKAHGKGETPGKVKRRGRFPDVLDAFMLSLIPWMPKRADGEDDDAKGRKPVPIKSLGETRKKKW
jgi:hypothetical protein